MWRASGLLVFNIGFNTGFDTKTIAFYRIKKMRKERFRMVRKKCRYVIFVALTLVIGVGCASPTSNLKKPTRTERARMLIQIANGAIIEGDAIGALQNLAEAEKENNRLPELFHSRALAFHQKKDLDKAILAARKAVELKPDYSDANNTLGKLLMDSGKHQEAIRYLELAANDSLYRESFKAWTNLGILKFRLEDYAQSEEFLNNAIKDSPLGSCIAYHYLGHISLKKKHFDEAIHHYEQATKKSCAGYGEARVSLGMAYEQNKQSHLARKVFLDVEKRFPNTQYAEQALEHLRYLP